MSNSQKNFNATMGILGCVLVGYEFGWVIGGIVFCLMPIVLRAVRRSGLPSNA